MGLVGGVWLSMGAPSIHDVSSLSRAMHVNDALRKWFQVLYSHPNALLRQCRNCFSTLHMLEHTYLSYMLMVGTCNFKRIHLLYV